MKLTRTVCLGVLFVFTLSACGYDIQRDRNPQITDMQLNALTMPEVARVSVPMPQSEAPGLPRRAERSSLWRTGSDGFFADQRAMDVGDILTINIEIDDQAQMSNRSQRARQGGASVGYPTVMGLEGIIGSITGAEEGDDLVDLGTTSSAEGSGRIDRAESISLEVAATVIQRLPNGNLVIAGRQEVMVNSELRELRVAGIIRPQDIQRDNTIPYDRIAEARITYGGRGQLTRQTRTSYGEDALDIILPY